MKLSALLAPLIAAKVPYQVILDTVLAYEAEQADALEKRRDNDKDRQARKREKDALSRESRDPSTKSRDRSLTGEGVTRVEGKTSSQKKTEQEESKKDAPNGDVLAFRDALSPFLDTERLEGLIKHRKTKKAPVTGHAAGLFLKAATAAGISVPDAVDVCIERGWLTVKADWLAPRGRAGPAQRAPELADVFKMVGRRLTDERQEREDSSGFRAAIPHLRASRPGDG